MDNLHILLAKYLAKETNANETAAVEAWAKENEANKKYLEQLQMIWDESKNLKYANNPDVQKALEAFRKRAATTTIAPVFTMRWLRVAAIIVLIAGVAVIIKMTNHSRTATPGVLKFMAGNLAQADTLPDGSVVALQPHAELVYPARFVTSRRNVELKGDAYFSVVHDANHPFQISVNNLQVKVLGTSFKISGTAGTTEVDVMTGVVLVTKEERSMKVFPYEKLIVPASGDLWIKQNDTLPGQLPQKVMQKSLPAKSATKQWLHTKPSTKKAGSNASYPYHLHVMALILDDVVKEGLAKDRDGIVWAALTDSVLIVNDKTQPAALHEKLKAKYNIVADQGYYYGPVKIYSKGYFFDNTDFNR